MKKYSILLLLLYLFYFNLFASSAVNPPVWGFFGHRLINKMAVFTLPPDMIGFYKKNIEYITDHAVDPDKRRYSSKLEAPRHFMDMEEYGTFPFENLPRTWYSFLATYANVFVVNEKKDTIKLMGKGIWRASGNDYKIIDDGVLNRLGIESCMVSKAKMHHFIAFILNHAYRNDDWNIPIDSFKVLFPNNAYLDKCTGAFSNSDFSLHGILPYNLEEMYDRLVRSFISKDVNKILRNSAEIGHYIADAHVPLHTSKNYNGQLTQQDGIHAFWESRIPELFADEEFDFLVGKAKQIDNTNSFFWKVIFDSHEGVSTVLAEEKKLKETFPSDRQFCYENRLQQVIRTQCSEFAKAYNLALDGQVEDRMRESIISVGSIWYSAWVSAGQPDLNALSGIVISEDDKIYFEQMDKDFQSGNSGFGRSHE